MTSAALHLTDDARADALLSSNPLALMIGMLLDQQVPMEFAFASPLRLAERLPADLDAAVIAETDPEDLAAMFNQTPALHRYPGSMAKRTQAMCQAIVDDHGGDAASIWTDVDNARELKKRLKALPGWGDMKARIFIALLAKQCDVAPAGWEDAAGDYSLEGHRSIADVNSPESLRLVRDFKKAQKAKA